MYAITNVNMKDLSNISKGFEKLPYKCYVQNRPKHEPTYTIFYLEINLAYCMMRADAFNSHVNPIRTKIDYTQHIMILHVF